ncbi:MAG: sigma-70 family RNA polymerase sigma factor [Eubacteriales bacterium]|nr:sigma-70 family RNA polymerase sigma factor [Eubacteriales bacterium]
MIQLVKRAMKSDTDAFLELMERCSGAMYKVARGILKNDEDVADAIQDTILTCFEKLHTLKKPEYFKTWMIRILINECNQILQHYRNLNMPEQFPDFGRHDSSLAEFEFKEMLEMVDEKYRIVLVLYYVEGFKVPEISKLLDMNENTVKTRLSRAREQIRSAYTDTNSSGKSKGNMAHAHHEDDMEKQGGDSDEKTNRFQFG